MEEFQQHRGLALKSIATAEHILNITYPVVQDTRLLLGVVENINLALSNTMFSIVAYERLFRRVPQHSDNFDSKFSLFRLKVVPRYNIDSSFAELIARVKDILRKHRQCPVEFTRKGKFVICSEGWKVESLGIQQLQQYIYKAKEFFELVNKITSRF
jgi:hypothetical protein